MKCAGPSGRDDAPDPSHRGQSETIGLILVFGMVLFGAVLVVSFGSAAVEQTQSGLSDQRAQKAMTQFDSKSALVALGNADSQAVDFPLRGQESLSVNDTAGVMTVIVKKRSGSIVKQKNWTLGALTFSKDDKALAYQGGGVWRKDTDTNESQMVSPPEFHFRNGTLTLPVITVTGEADIGQRANVNHSGTSAWFPNASAGRLNPLDDHTVFVRVSSEYYKGWGRYFEQRTDGQVTYNHPKNNVTIQLVTPIGTQRVQNAAASLAASGSFVIQGSRQGSCDAPGNVKAYTNSYNSSEPGSCSSQQNFLDSGINNHNGDVVYGKDVDFSSGAGTSDFFGDLKAGDKVKVPNTAVGGGQVEIYGNISYHNDCTPNPIPECKGRIKDTSKFGLQRNPGIQTMEAIDFYINKRVNAVEDNPDTDSDIDDTGPTPILDLTGDKRLPSGEYYVENLNVPSSETLKLDTSGGPVTVAVEENVNLGVGAEIEVTGPGVAKIFVNGTGADPDFTMAKKSRMGDPDQVATQLRVYGKADFNAVLGSGTGNIAKFRGVIFAPPGPGGSGTVDLDGAEVYGAVLTGTTTITNSGGGSIHYDNALQNENIIQPGAKIVKITYLHVSENRVEISG